MTRLGWAVVALLLGLVVGWWVGSFTTACDPARCQVNVDAIEAAGTWVGGLGTVAAVLFAARAFRSEERARREEQETRILQMQQEQDAKLDQRLAAERDMDRMRVEANLVVGVVGPHVFDHVQIRSIRVTVFNNANETAIFKVGGKLPGHGLLSTTHKLEGGQSVKAAVFGNIIGLRSESFPVAIDGKDREKFYADLTTALVLTFEMNGRQWRREGNRPAELMS